MTTPKDIQSHLYSSFLLGHTADVSLHVTGGWEAIYHLHRVVLIQAVSLISRTPDAAAHIIKGFFHSLFTAGFLESHHTSNNGGCFDSPPDEVNVRFDDVNITRSGMSIFVHIGITYSLFPAFECVTH